MPSANSHSTGLRDDPGAREGALPVGREQPAGMVEVQVAERDDIDAAGVEPGQPQGRQDGLATHAALRPMVVVHALADARLHQHAPRRRLHQQAVERLREGRVGVDLVDHQALPEGARHGPEDGARVALEDTRLDERHVHPAAQVDAPVDRRLDAHGVSRPCAAVRPWMCAGCPRSPGRRPTRWAATGPGTWTPAPASRTAAPPGWSSGRS